MKAAGILLHHRVRRTLSVLDACDVRATTAFEVKLREVVGECVQTLPAGRRYGPPVKGRGGKTKRW